MHEKKEEIIIYPILNKYCSALVLKKNSLVKKIGKTKILILVRFTPCLGQKGHGGPFYRSSFFRGVTKVIANFTINSS